MFIFFSEDSKLIIFYFAFSEFSFPVFLDRNMISITFQTSPPVVKSTLRRRIFVVAKSLTRPAHACTNSSLYIELYLFLWIKEILQFIFLIEAQEFVTLLGANGLYSEVKTQVFLYIIVKLWKIFSVTFIESPHVKVFKLQCKLLLIMTPPDDPCVHFVPRFNRHWQHFFLRFQEEKSNTADILLHYTSWPTIMSSDFKTVTPAVFQRRSSITNTKPDFINSLPSEWK